MPLRENADIQYTSAWGAAIPLPQHEKQDGTFAVTGEKNPLPIMSLGMLPVEVQAKATPQEKILAGVSVGAGTTTAFTSNLIDMNGYNSVSTVAVTSAAHNFTFELLSSPDGAAVISDNGVSRTGSTSTKKADSSNLMAYGVVRITNNDAASKTYDVWARKYNL